MLLLIFLHEIVHKSLDCIKFCLSSYAAKVSGEKHSEKNSTLRVSEETCSVQQPNSNGPSLKIANKTCTHH